MTEKQYSQRMEKVRRDNLQKQYRINIRMEKEKISKKRKIETSKLLAIYLFALLNTIVIYAMVSMWRFEDLSYLGVLITDIAAQILIYGIYCLKAYKSKKSEEEIRFQRDKECLCDTIASDNDTADGIGAEQN